MEKWKNKCLFCDHVWESNQVPELCPKCKEAETDDIYSEENIRNRETSL